MDKREDPFKAHEFWKFPNPLPKFLGFEEDFRQFLALRKENFYQK